MLIVRSGSVVPIFNEGVVRSAPPAAGECLSPEEKAQSHEPYACEYEECRAPRAGDAELCG